MSRAFGESVNPDRARETVWQAIEDMPTLEALNLEAATEAAREAERSAEAAVQRRWAAIREALRAGMTQRQVSAMTGLSQGRISQVANATEASQ